MNKKHTGTQTERIYSSKTIKEGFE